MKKLLYLLFIPLLLNANERFDESIKLFDELFKDTNFKDSALIEKEINIIKAHDRNKILPLYSALNSYFHKNDISQLSRYLSTVTISNKALFNIIFTLKGDRNLEFNKRKAVLNNLEKYKLLTPKNIQQLVKEKNNYKYLIDSLGKQNSKTDKIFQKILKDHGQDLKNFEISKMINSINSAELRLLALISEIALLKTRSGTVIRIRNLETEVNKIIVELNPEKIIRDIDKLPILERRTYSTTKNRLSLIKELKNFSTKTKVTTSLSPKSTIHDYYTNALIYYTQYLILKKKNANEKDQIRKLRNIPNEEKTIKNTISLLNKIQKSKDARSIDRSLAIYVYSDIVLPSYNTIKIPAGLTLKKLPTWKLTDKEQAYINFLIKETDIKKIIAKNLPMEERLLLLRVSLNNLSKKSEKKLLEALDFIHKQNKDELYPLITDFYYKNIKEKKITLSVLDNYTRYFKSIKPYDKYVHDVMKYILILSKAIKQNDTKAKALSLLTYLETEDQNNECLKSNILLGLYNQEKQYDKFEKTYQTMIAKINPGANDYTKKITTYYIQKRLELIYSEKIKKDFINEYKIGTKLIKKLKDATTNEDTQKYIQEKLKYNKYLSFLYQSNIFINANYKDKIKKREDKDKINKLISEMDKFIRELNNKDLQFRLYTTKLNLFKIVKTSNEVIFLTKEIERNFPEHYKNIASSLVFDYLKDKNVKAAARELEKLNEANINNISLQNLKYISGQLRFEEKGNFVESEFKKINQAAKKINKSILEKDKNPNQIYYYNTALALSNLNEFKEAYKIATTKMDETKLRTLYIKARSVSKEDKVKQKNAYDTLYSKVEDTKHIEYIYYKLYTLEQMLKFADENNPDEKTRKRFLNYARRISVEKKKEFKDKREEYFYNLIEQKHESIYLLTTKLIKSLNLDSEDILLNKLKKQFNKN